MASREDDTWRADLLGGWGFSRAFAHLLDKELLVVH